MADNISNANRLAGDAQKHVAAAAAIGINALRPILHFQVAMLRMWANSIERFAAPYDKGMEKTAPAVEEQSDKKRAA